MPIRWVSPSLFPSWIGSYVALCLCCLIGLGISFKTDVYRGMGLADRIKKNTEPSTPEHVNWLMMPRCFTLQQLEGYQRRFSSMDRDLDGKATREEIRDFLQMYKPNVTEARIERFLTRRDSNGNGMVDFIPDYVREMTRPDFSGTGAAEWFYLEDANDDGFVTVDELMRIAGNLGMSEDEAASSILGYYMSADRNHDNQLDWNEYKGLFQMGRK